MLTLEELRSHATDLWPYDLVNLRHVHEVAKTIEDTATRQGTVYLAGNGGSFANALHMSTDLTLLEEPHIVAHVLGANPCLASAANNDYGYSVGLTRELAGRLRPADTVIIFTVSAASPNILTLLEHAGKIGAATICMTGPNSPKPNPDICLRVPSVDYGRIESIHSIALHLVSDCLRGKGRRLVA